MRSGAPSGTGPGDETSLRLGDSAQIATVEEAGFGAETAALVARLIAAKWFGEPHTASGARRPSEARVSAATRALGPVPRRFPQDALLHPLVQVDQVVKHRGEHVLAEALIAAHAEQRYL